MYCCKRTGNYIYWNDERDVWYHDLIKDVSNQCDPEMMKILFLFFTSGSTGKPKECYIQLVGIWFMPQ